MSNFLAVATVTAALTQMLQQAIATDIPGATVSTLGPHNNGNGAAPPPALNVYLHQVTPNTAFSNDDLPTRRGSGELVQRPQTALDLQYLLTFYGDESQLEPQRLLGSAVRVLHAKPVITRDTIRHTIAMPVFSFLAESNLADAVELVRLSPVPMSVDELSRLWSVYFQIPYSLSLVYRAAVIFIESQVSTQPALPVRTRSLYVIPFRQPAIESIQAADGTNGFILPESGIVVSGKQLRGDQTSVNIGGVEVVPAAENVHDTQIIVQLPAVLRAGVQGLQVIQSRMIGTPPVAHRGVESNVAPFVLHPVIRRELDGAPQVVVSPPVLASDGTRSADVTVRVNPNVDKMQRVALLMNQVAAAPPRAYRFDALPRNAPTDPEETDTLVFAISGVVAGDYLLRVQIDGAESALDQDPDASNPVYNGPGVTIP